MGGGGEEGYIVNLLDATKTYSHRPLIGSIVERMTEIIVFKC